MGTPREKATSSLAALTLTLVFGWGASPAVLAAEGAEAPREADAEEPDQATGGWFNDERRRIASHILFGRAYRARDQGQTDEAIAYFRQGLARDPSRVQVRSDLAKLLLRAGRAHEARVEWERVLRQQPAHPEARRGHAQVLWLLGHVEAARRSWASQANDPRLAEAHRQHARERLAQADSRLAAAAAASAAAGAGAGAAARGGAAASAGAAVREGTGRTSLPRPQKASRVARGIADSGAAAVRPPQTAQPPVITPAQEAEALIQSWASKRSSTSSPELSASIPAP